MPEILIYSDIGPEEWGGVSAKSVKAQLDTMNDAAEITVRINSPGGDVFDGFAIYNLLAQHPAKINVKVDGWAASAASVIMMAGDTREVAENALVMIHNPWTLAVGDATGMRKTADLLDQIRDSIVTTYKAQAPGLDDDEIRALMDAETWFDAQGAVEAGLATAIVGKSDKAKKNTVKSWIRNAPQEPVELEAPEYRIAARARFPIS
jgi:ATP-dependent protease ClpP protease subunit